MARRGLAEASRPSTATPRAAPASSTTSFICRPPGLEPAGICEGPADRQARLTAQRPRKHVVQEVPALRIVSQDLWDRVKMRRAAMAHDSRPDVTGERPF